jgi:DNA primase catalytic subunit
MATKEELVTIIKQWINNDNEVKQLQSQLRNKKKENKQLTDNLINVMKSNELECIDIKNGKLVHKTSKTKKPINKQSLISILNTYFKDDTKAAEISQYVFENRPQVFRDYIHRKVNN